MTNKSINDCYNYALNNGAIGGKLVGAGGGGFLLMYCKKRNHLSLKKRLNKLPIIKFNFSEKGSEIIFKS